jgi:hypothetical protein
MKKKKKFLDSVWDHHKDSFEFPPTPQCKVTQSGLFDNGKTTMKISLSISQWKNSKNKTLKYWSHNSLAELSVYV